MPRETPTAGQGSAKPRGVVTGFVWKLIRETVGLTQWELAERLGVDGATIQSWESGRRPLTALRATDLARMRIRLIALGCPPQMFDVLADAIDADLVIDHVLIGDNERLDLQYHPLAATVHRRTLTNLITWPFSGLAPAQLRAVEKPDTKRRGPSASQPTLTADDRRHFFDHLLRAAEVARGHSVLKRQAVYLLSFDASPDTRSWLESDHLRAMRSVDQADELPSWLAVRSSAVSLTRCGHYEPLEAFISACLTSHQQELANLNYWAYWLGEISNTQVDDLFMVRESPQNWNGGLVFRHLLERIEPEAEQLALNVKTLWQLVLARPAILKDQIDLRRRAMSKIGVVLDNADLGPQVRRDLSDIAYAVKLSER